MYDREHRFFASALVVSLVACVAFAAALGLAPSQKAYADEPTRASGYTEVQLLEYINTNMEALLEGLGMYGENTSQSHPTFRWLYTSIQQIANWIFQIYAKMDDIQDNVQYAFNRLTDIRAALVADTIEINGQVRTTVRNYARLAAENTDSMTTVLQAWNRDMGASQNGTATDATWFSTVSSRLLATVNAINSANTNLISIDSKFWEYFLVPQRWQQQDGSYYYSPAYYLQFLKLQYDRMQSYFITNEQVSVGDYNYRTPHYYLDRIYVFVQNIDYYVSQLYTDIEASISGMKTDTDLLVKLFSQDSVTINGNTFYTPYHYLKYLYSLDQSIGTASNGWLNAETEEYLYGFRQSWNSLLNVLNDYLGSMKTDTDLLVKLFSQDSVTINGNTFYTPYHYLKYLYSLDQSIGTASNGWLNAETEEYLYGFRQSWNSLLTMLKTYFDSIINLLETPDSSTANQLIGDFDDETYAQNMQQLRQQLGQVGVFSAVTSLGMIVYTISDADSLQTPSLDVPFEFAGSNDHLVIDLSWLDDFKPMINFACMALLFLQLSAWTVEAVKET